MYALHNKSDVSFIKRQDFHLLKSSSIILLFLFFSIFSPIFMLHSRFSLEEDFSP